MRALILLALLAAPAYADGDIVDALARGPAKPDTVAHAEPDHAVQLVGDVRGMFLVRSDNNYFQHATKSGYDFPGTAGGIDLTAGALLGERVTLGMEAFYVVDGGNRGDARLRLASGAIAGLARFAVVGFREAELGMQLDATAGFGRYYIKETFVDPSLSPMVYGGYEGSFGGFGGAEASLHTHAFRVVLAYAYHYAPAAIADRVRGTVEAGGHEISIGIGVVL